MNKRKSIGIVLLSLCVIIISCQEIVFDIDNLFGEWKVAKWEVEKTGDLRTNQMDMDFKADKTYEIDYGSEVEIGRFWIANDFLHTVEDGKTEKKVKVVKLTRDTLMIQMNRGGELENVLMLRK